MSSRGFLEKILGGKAALRDFLLRHYTRAPYSRPHGAPELTSLLNWEVLGQILSMDGSALSLFEKGREVPEKLSTLAQLQSEFARGRSIRVRQAEKSHAGLGEMAQAFERELSAPVDVQLFATPAGEQTFPWHYDVEEVFLIQCSGAKEYVLRRNNLNPWPVLESLPKDLGFERELGGPQWRCLLQAGDWLYVPSGYWHSARAESDSMTISVGLTAPTLLDFLDQLRERLPAHILWRQRLPLGEAFAALDVDAQEEARGVLDRCVEGALQDLIKQARARLSELKRAPRPLDETCLPHQLCEE